MEVLNTNNILDSDSADNDTILIRNFIRKCIEYKKDKRNQSNSFEQIVKDRREEINKISDELSGFILDNFKLYYNDSDTAEAVIASITNGVLSDVRKGNNKQTVGLLEPTEQKQELKERVKPTDREVIQKAYALLKGLDNSPPEVINALALLEQQLETDKVLSTSWTKRISDERASEKEISDAADLPTVLPKIAPIKWANRKTFVVSEIADDYTRKRLEANPELVEQIRACDPSSALTFLDAVYGGYTKIKLGQKEVRSLDKRLFDLCWQVCASQGKKLNEILDTVSQKIDKQISEVDFCEFNRLASSLDEA